MLSVSIVNQCQQLFDKNPAGCIRSAVPVLCVSHVFKGSVLIINCFDELRLLDSTEKPEWPILYNTGYERFKFEIFLTGFMQCLNYSFCVALSGLVFSCLLKFLILKIYHLEFVFRGLRVIKHALYIVRPMFEREDKPFDGSQECQSKSEYSEHTSCRGERTITARYAWLVGNASSSGQTRHFQQLSVL